MSTKMEEGIKRWTASFKKALMLEIVQRKKTMPPASRQCDLSPSDVDLVRCGVLHDVLRVGEVRAEG